jgi:hypothetical protein
MTEHSGPDPWPQRSIPAFDYINGAGVSGKAVTQSEPDIADLDIGPNDDYTFATP